MLPLLLPTETASAPGSVGIALARFLTCILSPNVPLCIRCGVSSDLLFSPADTESERALTDSHSGSRILSQGNGEPEWLDPLCSGCGGGTRSAHHVPQFTRRVVSFSDWPPILYVVLAPTQVQRPGDKIDIQVPFLILSCFVSCFEQFKR